MKTRFTREMNEELGQDFTKAKLELALNQILPLKSSGMVGFRANFYQ